MLAGDGDDAEKREDVNMVIPFEVRAGDRAVDAPLHVFDTSIESRMIVQHKLTILQ